MGLGGLLDATTLFIAIFISFIQMLSSNLQQAKSIDAKTDHNIDMVMLAIIVIDPLLSS